MKKKTTFYAANKLRRPTYLCTPSGNHNKAEALLLLSLSVLYLFYIPFTHNSNIYVTPFRLVISVGFAAGKILFFGELLHFFAKGVGFVLFVHAIVTDCKVIHKP